MIFKHKSKETFDIQDSETHRLKQMPMTGWKDGKPGSHEQMERTND